ncbi:MAG: hypothetical protein Rubg2KO_35150 [Rubricoccaceae bacterium]
MVGRLTSSNTMHRLVLALALLVWGCSSPCDTLNGKQIDATMQTCAFSASLNEDLPMVFSPEDGAPVLFTVEPEEIPASEMPDGTEVAESYFGLSWTGTGGDLSASDSASAVASDAIAPDGQLYALADYWSPSVTIRDASGSVVASATVPEGVDRSLGLERPNRATSLLFSSDGATLLGADPLGNVTAWRSDTGESLWSTTLDAAIRDLALSPDGQLVAAPSAHGVRVLDIATGQVTADWQFPGKTSVVGLAFAPDSRHVAVRKSGRYMPSTVRYSSFDENGQRTDIPFKDRTEGYVNDQTVFLMGLP